MLCRCGEKQSFVSDFVVLLMITQSSELSICCKDRKSFAVYEDEIIMNHK